MKFSRKHVRGSFIAAVLACAAALGIVRPRAAESATASVYYQVTYADGSVKDLSQPPETSEGVERVVRVTHESSGQAGYEITATGPDVLTVINPDTISRQELTWNGSQWTAPEQKEEPKEPQGPPLSRELELRRLKHIAAGLTLQRAALAEQVANAEKQLEESAGKPGEADARAKLAEARRDMQECTQLLAEYDAALRLAEIQAKHDEQEQPNRPDGSDAEREARIRNLEALLFQLRQQAVFFDLASVETEGSLFEEAGTADAPDTRWRLEAIRRIRQDLQRQIAACEKKLSELKAERKAEDEK